MSAAHFQSVFAKSFAPNPAHFCVKLTILGFRMATFSFQMAIFNFKMTFFGFKKARLCYKFCLLGGSCGAPPWFGNFP